jgi:hypothetical protein
MTLLRRDVKLMSTRWLPGLRAAISLAHGDEVVG